MTPVTARCLTVRCHGRIEQIDKRNRIHFSTYFFLFSLFSFLDSQARESNVKANVAYMKPFTKKIEKSIWEKNE